MWLIIVVFGVLAVLGVMVFLGIKPTVSEHQMLAHQHSESELSNDPFAKGH
ncbi:hypothetical protein [Aquirhabdus sp.]|uniref:hypothetical protein n=1 Tax=Aquirhabdus sp. TaxID=2824160 RepID=UPI00396C85AE